MSGKPDPRTQEQLRRALAVVTDWMVDGAMNSTALTTQAIQATRDEGEQAHFDLTVGLVHLCRIILQQLSMRDDLSELDILQLLAARYT